ncbi:MAG: ferritin family protein [Nitrospiraceae bacterium]|nr:ferritin family protein [Nitrospiraceae bacterium]
MADFFNAFEVFEMAEQVERNGSAFYRKAAGAAKDEGLKEVLLQLSGMEQEHVRIFSSMKQELSGQPWAEGFEEENEAVLYLRALASGEVFDQKENPADLVETMSMTDVLRKAIALEKESIAFYTGIKELVPAEFGKGRIDDIIREEMRHVRMLSERLDEMAEF